MARATDVRPPGGHRGVVPADASLKIAIVSRDRGIRLLAAQAFDTAPATWQVELYETVPRDVDVVVVGPDVDSKDAITFDPQRPQEIIETIEKMARPGRGGLTVVTSGSGGTGTTSIALHLAACARGEAVYVDFDVIFGASRRLNLPEKHLTWRDVGGSTESLVLAALPLPGGFRGLLSPGDGDGPENPGQLLDRASASFDRVVVDVPTGDLLGISLERAANAVLVLRPDVVSAHRSRPLLDEFPDVRWAVVVNRLGAGGETTMSGLKKLIGYPIALELPCAPALRDAADDGGLLTSSFWRYRRAIVRLNLALECA